MNEENGLTGIIVLFIKLKELIVRKIATLIIFAIIGGALGALLSIKSKPVYSSSSSIMIESGGGGGLSKYLSLAQSFGLGGGGQGAVLSPENIRELLLSKRIVFTALLSEVESDGQTKKLAEAYKDIFISPEDSLYDVEIKTAQPFNCSNKNEEIILRKMYSTITKNLLSVRTFKTNALIKLNTTSSNKHFSYHFTNAVVDGIYHYYLDNIERGQKDALTIIENKRDSIIALLQQKEAELARLTDNSRLTVKSQANIETMRAMRDVELLNRMYATTIQNLEITKFSNEQNKSIFKIIDTPQLAIKNQKRGLISSIIIFTIIFGFLGIGFLFIQQEFKKAKEHLNKG